MGFFRLTGHSSFVSSYEPCIFAWLEFLRTPEKVPNDKVDFRAPIHKCKYTTDPDPENKLLFFAEIKVFFFFI